MISEQARGLIIQALEMRLAGRPVQLEALVKVARIEPEFSRAWLGHAIASDAGALELAVAVALAAGHGLAELSQLRDFWSGQQTVEPESVRGVFEKNAPRGVRWPESNAGIVLAVKSLSENDGVRKEKPVSRLALPVDIKWLDWVCQFAEPQLRPASVYGQEVNQAKLQIRDSDQALMPTPTAHPILASIERLICQCSGIPIRRAEPLVVLRYRPGQQYRWHRDYIQPSAGSVSKELSVFGQRVHTGILYLNEAFEGGATEFRDWELCLRPTAGTVVSFSSIHEDGRLNPASVHRGAPVESGEKWIATLWYRDRPIWSRRGLIDIG